MGLKVAIIGLSDSQVEAPFDDPEWEKWGLPWGPSWARMDRLFEIHDIEYETIDLYNDDYFEKLTYCGVPLYMQDNFLPNAILYPLEEVAKVTGDYFTGSVIYMMALAIYEKAEEISLYGIDMSDEPHEHQRPNMEYLIGLARGRGIKVNILDSSPLCKYQDVIGYPKRYGYVN